MNPITIAPSLLSSDFAAFGSAARACEDAGAEWLHFDVMDGRFVPNITFGPGVVKAVRPHSRAVFDVHLMIVEPEKWIEAFAEAGADYITVHAEATRHLHRVLTQIRGAGAKAGLAVNPATPLDMLPYVMADVDMLLIMTVNPGFGGQSFIPAMVDKIAAARRLFDDAGTDTPIEVDGGIGDGTAARVVSAGATILVAGNSVFTHPGGLADGVRALRASADAAPDRG